MKGIASRLTAIHEAGHCLIGYIKYHNGELEREPAYITIVQRARYRGLHVSLAVNEPEVLDITAIKAYMEVSLGAAAAVEV